MIIMVGTITIPTTPICTFIPGVPLAGVSAWDLDTLDGECPTLMVIPIVHITGMEDITADIHITDMADTTGDTGVDTIPTTEVPTGPDTTMVSTTDIITVVATITLLLTDTAGWTAGILMDIQDPPT